MGAAVKSALDGAAIGFPVGALGAVASAVRAAKNLPADQQVEKMVEVFAEKIQQTELPLGQAKASLQRQDGLNIMGRSLKVADQEYFSPLE